MSRFGVSHGSHEIVQEPWLTPKRLMKMHHSVAIRNNQDDKERTNPHWSGKRESDGSGWLAVDFLFLIELSPQQTVELLGVERRRNVFSITFRKSIHGES
jgi:hypothetical protein